jgi:hypothetical protein
VVVIFVVNRQFLQPLADELTATTGTDMREEAECPLAITSLANLQIPTQLLKDLRPFFRIRW